MTNREVINRVTFPWNNGVPSDDSRLRNRQVYSELKSARVLLMLRRYKNRTPSEYSLYTIPCVELIEAPIHECPCAPATGCLFLRSKYPLPEPMFEFYTSVTTLDGSEEFSPTTWMRKRVKQHNKYTAKTPDYFIRNNYLYIMFREKLKYVAVSDPWVDPEEAYDFPSPCADETNTTDCVGVLDQDFNIEEELLHECITITKNEIMKFYGVKEDRTNDTRDQQT
jgi:hypothetical protein